MNCTGVVSALSQKGKGASFQIDKTWYGAGFVSIADLPFNKGDKISFEFTENGQWKNADLKSVKVLGKQEATPSASSPGGSRDWDAKNKLDAERQSAISVQSCRNSAIEVAKMLRELDALPVGSKKADIADNLVAFVDDLTDKYFRDTQAIAAGKKREEVVQQEGEFE